MGEIKTLGYYVNGEWKKSAAEHYTDAFDPSTGKVIAKVPCFLGCNSCEKKGTDSLQGKRTSL